VISSFFGPYAYPGLLLPTGVCHLFAANYHMSQTETEKTVQDAGFESHHNRKN
jgi:hypothetical protein